MSKTLEQWRELWDSVEGENFTKALALLRDYSNTGSGKTSLFSSLFQWKTYAVEVANALKPYNDASNAQPQTTQVRDIIENIAKQINGPISTGGDLSKIMQVIEDKAGVKYSEVLAAVEAQARHDALSNP